MLNLKKHLVVATIESPPFMMKQINTVNGTVEWYGYCIDLFNELIRQLPYQVTYEIHQVADNKFGTKKLEHWTGLIGELQRGKSDLALAPLAVMAERELAIDFTVPFYDLVGIQVLLKKPEVPHNWFKFLTVLDNEVWLSMTTALFVTAFIMFLFDRLSPYSHKNLSRIRKLKQSQKKNSGDNPKPLKSVSGFVNPSNGPLARSHELFVGSSSIQTHENNKKPQFITPLDIKTNRGRLLYPTGLQLNEDLPEKLEGGGVEFRDYLRNSPGRLSSLIMNAGNTDDSDTDDSKPEFGLRDSLWFCITSLTPQGGGEAPQNLSGRIVAGAWWLFCFIIIASYTANLAAFLTVSRLELPIENLDDLVKQYRIKYAPIDGTAEHTYFERMAYIEEIFYNIWKEMSLNDSLSEEERSKFAVWDYPISDKYTKIWAQIQQVGMPSDVEIGLNRVKNSNLDDGFALLADANIVKYAVMTDCRLKAVGDEFSRKPIALGVRKGDDKLREELSYAILKLINQRYMEVLREKWWTNNPNKLECRDADESEGIGIENIGGVFIIIFGGVVFSFLVWAVERLLYRTKIEVSQEPFY